MKFNVYIFLFILSVTFTYSQNGTSRKYFNHTKKATVNFANIHQDFSPALLVREMPNPGSKKTEYYYYPKTEQNSKQNQKTQTTLSDLNLGTNFFANPFSASTPTDNDIAISDSGIIVSVINTSILVYNTKTSTASPVKSLSAFTAPVNNRNQEFDPKVMYDPKADKFVLMCPVGFVDSTSKIIVGFSQTNDPNGNWNLYTLPGNPLNNNLWSDYPMISMTEKELFLSINLLYNDSSWQTGFVETVIWQMKKDSGYAGLPLGSYLHHDIKFNGKAIRNLCPAKGGSKLYTPNMFFVSNRNLASQNDTVFLVEVTDTIGAPTNTVITKALITNQPYYFPPNGRQSVASQSLATNDCRTLGAFYENNKIQYVHNTNNPLNNHVTVYYGVIDNPQNSAPTATGYIINNDTVDFAYPNISYAGLNNTDNMSIISFDHSSNKIFPGISAIKADGSGNFSNVLRIKNGVAYVNILSGNLERWGDYSGSQLQYNKPGEIWMSGYYGYNVGSSGINKNKHGAWVAQLTVNPSIPTALTNENKTSEVVPLIFPNPAQDLFNVDIHLSQPEYLSFELYDATGKLVDVLLRDWVKTKDNTFNFSLRDVSKGIYFLKITGKSTSVTKKIIKQ
ncbi:MAG: T9SS type A sorting domain-containing protein [Bacteroidia bacterium]|nr:T9SS type A sorting domain-containing protein [Bacteroidia bacterium]